MLNFSDLKKAASTPLPEGIRRLAFVIEKIVIIISFLWIFIGIFEGINLTL